MKFTYYDNWAKTPMKIFLYLGIFLTGSALFSSAKVLSSTGGRVDTEYLLPYFIGGIICLGLFFVFKVINKKENDKILYEAIDDWYKSLVDNGMPIDVAKEHIQKDLAGKYMLGKMDPSLYGVLTKYVEKM